MDILAPNLLILASAGSGKTFQLGNRIIGLVARGADPARIVALTFTRKAAGEFADSVLTKLAEAAAEEHQAVRLREDLAMPGADFKDALGRVVRALPLITLGTIDGFFAGIVRSFQYELGLTGGRFDLLEGARAAAVADEMLAGILGDFPTHKDSEEFFQAFRRATIGREDQTVGKSLRDFVAHWHGRFRESPGLEWGPRSLETLSPDDWANRKSGLATALRRDLDLIEYTRKGQREALEREIANLENHVIGSGSLGSRITSLMAGILDAVATQTGPLILNYYKEFVIGGAAGATLREMVELAAHCEFAASLQRTRAVRQVISAFDDLCCSQLRRNGLLGFNDVKLLMGDWARNENSRLRREAVDFRLDARIDHWLLDEFQDTSRADWNGLLPLVDEAASDDDGTTFIVGDRKQAIYAWRGGDVSLFDEIISRYGSGLEIAPMAESWRSCPEVLALVNRVCGDHATLRELFGDAAGRWDWQDHFPAMPLALPDKRGHARVEIVGDWEARLERLGGLLNELGIGRRAMTCGILLRGNDKARQVADDLRARGFDVIEEGRREPGKDNPVGIVIANLLKWLADPADSHARGVVEMSPLAELLIPAYGSSWRGAWEALTSEASQAGFAQTIGRLIGHCWPSWSAFGRRRAGDVLAGLADLDHRGGCSAREAAAWTERLELSQSPGVAAVQVMTIHKAKGLGFDVVILPEIPDEAIPQPQFFDVAEGQGWLTQTPPKWARAIIPELREAETRWNTGQRYEAFCMLYVALTRAKRGLHVLLEPAPKAGNADRASLANWLARSVGNTNGTGEAQVLHESGDGSWTTKIPDLKPVLRPETIGGAGPAIPRRSREKPSRHGAKSGENTQSPSGMEFGTAVHALFEQVSWVDEVRPVLPDGAVGGSVARTIREPALKEVFERQGRMIDLYREQPIDVLVDGKMRSCVIDRLHVHLDDRGHASRIEIIDFKTDLTPQPSDLAELYSGQMEAYRTAIRRIYPETGRIDCALLSVRHGELVFV